MSKQLRVFQGQGDVVGMANTAIASMGPLPPIDADRFAVEVEDIYWDWLYASKSDQSEWWEKSAAHVMMRVAAVAQRYQVHGELDTVRSFRASMMYDSVAFRLHPKLDMSEEYRLFEREAGDRAKARVKKSYRKREKAGGLSRQDYVLIEEMQTMVAQALIKAQRALDVPTRHFAHLMGKASYLASAVMQVTSLVLFLAAAAVGFAIFVERSTGQPVRLSELLSPVFSAPTLVGVMVLASWVLRRMRRRLTTIDVRR